jgi:uncharacterized protein (TIGR02271 family)
MSNNSEERDAAAADSLVGARLIDAAGHPASIVSAARTDGEMQAAIRLAGGTEIRVPIALLAAQADGSYRLPFSVAAIDDAVDGAGSDSQAQLHFPVMQEALQVDTRTVDTGRGVRLHKSVDAQEKTVDLPLLRDELAIEHVAIGQVVADAPPLARYEGDTLVVPVLEEVLVVQKQLLLKEEVRITRLRRQVHAPQSVTLKSEQVTVERFDEGSRTSS